MLRRGVPGFVQAQAARRQPRRVGGVELGLGLDRQRQGRRACVDQLARLGALQGVLLRRARLHQRGAERLRRNCQRPAALGVDRVAGFDHAMANAVDDFFIGARLAQLLHACIGDLQGRQAAVVVQRHRMIHAHGQQGLGLHVDAGLVEAGFDKHRRQFGAGVLAGGFDHLQGNRLGLELAHLQRRDHHRAVFPGQQGDDPACGRVVIAAQGSELVDLARAADFELRIQGRQVGFAELGHVAGLHRQFHRFPGIEAAAVDAGDQVRRLGVACRQGEQEQKGGAAAHRVLS
ncbi:hypothetical protein [Pseudomonas sp. 34 E 7]|nr:hypothetical protein [Pseudomonas sp. 34 E 7]